MSSEAEQRGSRLWRWYLGGGLTTAVGYFLFPHGGLTQAVVFVGVHLSALVAMVLGVRVHRPRHSSIWYLIIAGEALYAVANFIWYLYPVGFGRVLPFPSVADAVYLCGYALILPGLGLLIQARIGRRDGAGLIDTAIVTVGLGVLSWLFFMEPVLSDSSLSGLAQLTSVAYPLIGILFLGILVRLLFSPGAGLPAYRFLVVGLLAQLVADTSYTISSLQGTFSFGAWYFACWLIFYVCLGTAVLHPSMRQLSEPAPGHEAVLTGRRLGFLAAAALISPAVLVVIDADRNAEYVLAATSGVLFLLVLARMRGLLVYIAEHERMKRLKDEFTSMVSHELRTPLTSIRGALGLVAGGALGPVPDKAQRMLDIAKDNTERLMRLINDILDIERMESGQITLEKKPCRADDLVGRAADAMRAMADEAGVTLSVEAGDAGLWADEDRMMQTVTNLVSNAVKFSPRGSTVRLTAARRGGDVVFVVEDEGRGIPPEHLERIFAPFQQVDSSDSREKGGTGLGLAICRSIVAQHGGRIWAESTPGQGAKLSFSVPALDEAPRSEPPVRAAPLVLVCDDDPSVREVVTAILERRAYRVVTASSAEEAVEVAAVQQPAAILLDLLMPGLSGWDAATLLKQHCETRHIPIVILSVLSQREAEEVTGNVVDWVQKPLDEPTLFGALEKAVSGSHKPSRVLIVEDDLDLAHVLTAMLEHNGVEVLHAGDGGEAIRLSQRFVPDLVVLDLELPRVDGFAVVEWMRRHDRLRHASLVVYTVAELDDADRERLRLGHTEFLTKGCVTPEDFDGRVTDLLDKLARVGDVAGDRNMADDAA